MGYTIKRHLAVFETKENGWKKEFNLVQTPSGESMYDIRFWSPDHKEMGEGTTLSPSEMTSIVKTLSAITPQIRQIALSNNTAERKYMTPPPDIKEKTLYSGTAGDCKWGITTHGTLGIMPSSPDKISLLDNYVGENRPPWSGLSEEIQRVVIRPGVRANTNANFLFANLPYLQVIQGLGNLDLSNTVSIDGMFSKSAMLCSADFKSLDTENIESMSRMFYGCKSLTELDLSSWNTRNLTSADNMFALCSALTNLNAPELIRKDVTNTELMFAGCSSLSNINISKWDTSGLQKANLMFYGCDSIETMDLSGWDVSNLRECAGMFEKCLSLHAISFAGWAPEKLEIMDEMFKDCKNLDNLDLSSFSVNKEFLANLVFEGCDNLQSYDIEGWSNAQKSRLFVNNEPDKEIRLAL